MIHALTLALALLLSPSASAADPKGKTPGVNTGGGGGAGGGDCWKDAQKLCPDAEAGSGFIADCLKKHLPKVSEACKASHPEWAAPAPAAKTPAAAPAAAAGPSKARAEWRAACGEAYEKHCGSVDGAKPIAACMAAIPAKTRDGLHVGCRALIKRRTPPKPRATKKP